MLGRHGLCRQFVGAMLSLDVRRRWPVWILRWAIRWATCQQGGNDIKTGYRRVMWKRSRNYTAICHYQASYSTVQDKGIIGRKSPLAALAALSREPRQRPVLLHLQLK